MESVPSPQTTTHSQPPNILQQVTLMITHKSNHKNAAFRTTTQLQRNRHIKFSQSPRIYFCQLTSPWQSSGLYFTVVLSASLNIHTVLWSIATIHYTMPRSIDKSYSAPNSMPTVLAKLWANVINEDLRYRCCFYKHTHNARPVVTIHRWNGSS